MRKITVSAIAVTLVVVSLLFTPFQRDSATAAKDTKESTPAFQDTAGQAMPGNRCTRLTRKQKEYVPASRCARLWAGAYKEFLPNTPPKVGLSFSTGHLGPGAPAEVKLSAIACDLEDENLLYTITTTGGRVAGDGADAVWNLSGVSPGTYTATVEVDDGCGCISFTSGVVTVSDK